MILPEGGGFKYNSHAARPGVRPRHGGILLDEFELAEVLATIF
jgi:hypothetical protein